jgi:biopolymer transport protein ExbD
MARYGRIRSRDEEDPDINMIPVMNMFMVLIPFLLMSASFFDIKAINTSIPVHADTPSKEAAPQKTQKITVVLEIKSNEIRISALSDTPNDLQLSSMETVLPTMVGGQISVAAVADHLKSLKDRYPASDTMILIPDDEVSYHEIIRAMDCARRYESEELFTNVVLSGSLG